MAIPHTIDEYLETVTPAQKAVLMRLRELVKQTVPDAEEKISYKMPAYTYQGKPLIYFSAFKHHMSLFGSFSAVEHKLEGKFKLSHKGTLQFTTDNPVPAAIFKEILINRRDEIRAGIRLHS